MATSEMVSVEGHRLKLSNLDKVLYPETGTTKADVLSYFAEIAPAMIPHIADRPVTRKRWVNGVDGDVFFQKNLEDSAPSWVRRRSIDHKNHTNEYPLANDLATVTWFGQVAALELHVPQWRFGRTGTPRKPDRFVLDLDPGEGVGLAECAEVARWARAILRDIGLDPMPVTSGSKGIHLYAALDGSQDTDTISAVAHELARALEADHPDLEVSDMKKSLRTGKVLVDWSQNNGNKTTIAPYSLRGRSRPTVAAPRSWSELASKDLAQLEYTEVLRRVKRRGDLLADLSAGHLESLEPTPDRLATYRSKRDASKTPEPVPDTHGDTEGFSFVIQEHHASRLHWDFRLEHEGVLVSWALHKGVPTDPKKNHLAVQTEDHPLEYGAFEGDIPKGEYGAGHVDIWDRGTYELEKWRDGKEVIATLHGEKQGGHRYALIHTHDDNWLIHLMKDEPATTSSKRPDGVKPMLATLGEPGALDPDEDWAYEMKWDGYRAIAIVHDGSVTFTSRNGRDLTPTYPELAEVAGSLRGSAVIDGEIVALDRKGRPDFGLLQRRQKDPKAARVQFMAFDLLEHDGTSLVRRRYSERRDLLERHVTEQGPLHVPPAFGGDEEAALASSRELGLEGVVAKRTDSVYLPGRRGSGWVKLKHHRTQEVVVAGWRPGSGARSGRIGSLLLGVPGDDGLRYVGRVGTGFREKDLEAIAKRLAPLARKTTPLADVPSADARDAHWVRPSLVAEVEFAEWTTSGRLRQPTWRGWRPDKDPDDVRIER